ncbi:MAG: histidinol-phosphate transaminase [Gemmatimonas sp.]
MSIARSDIPTVAHTPLSQPSQQHSLTRREWLVASGLGAAATVALPGFVAASPSPIAGATDFTALERAATAARRAAGPIRLSSNENPFGMSPKAKAAIMDAWHEHSKYSPPALPELAAVFAKSVGVPPECVLVTQGSSEVLNITALTFGLHGGEIVTAWPTFEGLPRYGDTIGATVHRVPLTASLDHDFDMMDRRTTNSVNLVFVCNPNNPTGVLANSKRVRDFVTSVSRRTNVLVDEAYHDFVDDPSYTSMVDLVRKGENVIISRTASKIHGLAGLRVGFAIARPDIIERMRLHVTGNPNSFGMRAAIASVNDTEYQAFVRTRTIEERLRLTKTLRDMGKRVIPSHTNFVFFQTGIPLETVQNSLRDKGFLVGRAFPPYNDWCRVSIGTPEEMASFNAVLPAALKV